MESRERVKRCLEKKKPDRPPRDVWPLPYITEFRKDEYESLIKQYPMDIKYLGEVDRRLFRIGQYKDEWGSMWKIGELGVVGEVVKPVIDKWDKLMKLDPPYQIIKNRDFSTIEKECLKSKKFVLSEVSARPFERMQFLRGTQNLLMDIAYGKKEFYDLLDIVHQFFLEDIKSWTKTPVDGIFLMDDWGSNNSLLISPESWKKIFKPLYEEYFRLIHAKGKYIFFHSDGFIEAILDDLIDIGVDALNSQLFVMDIEEIGKKYKGRLTFWGEIDRQHILPFGSAKEIEAGVRRLMDNLYDIDGGFIANCSWSSNDPYENITTFYSSWDKLKASF